jgi:hypothetical protein
MKKNEKNRFSKIIKPITFSTCRYEHERFRIHNGMDFAETEKMPLLFIGHGHPMNALFDNAFTQSLQNIHKKIQKPTAIMVVPAAHWETRGTFCIS